MKLLPVKLITIVALDSLAERLIAVIKEAGAKGYTISEVEGEGIHNQHFSNWEGRNIRIDSIVREDVAINIMEILARDYFDQYSIIAYVTEAQVLRKERFDG
jgi:nitrogen regulatory protein P-II 2